MTAQQTSRVGATHNFNHLRRGETYRAITRAGSSVGEYLGMETPYGDRAILLRHEAGTESISLHDITSINPAAA